MKRSEMELKILKLLKKYENSELDSRLAKKIIDLITKNGMLPPPSENGELVFIMKNGITQEIRDRIWDKEY